MFFSEHSVDVFVLKRDVELQLTNQQQS